MSSLLYFINLHYLVLFGRAPNVNMPEAVISTSVNSKPQPLPTIKTAKTTKASSTLTTSTTMIQPFNNHSVIARTSITTTKITTSTTTATSTGTTTTTSTTTASTTTTTVNKCSLPESEIGRCGTSTPTQGSLIKMINKQLRNVF